MQIGTRCFSKSLTCALWALLLTALVAQAMPIDQARNAECPTDAMSEDIQNEISEISRSIDRIVVAQEAVLASQQTSRAEELALRDLDAQESMAIWAKISTFVAFLSILLSGGGLIALLMSLRLNRQATQAAENAVVVAKQSNTAQSRAWVSVACSLGAPKVGRTQAGVNGIYFNVCCTAKNHGNSPATGVSFHAEMILLGIDCFSKNEGMIKYCDSIRTRAGYEAEAVFPGATIQVSHMVFLPLDSIESSIRGKDFKSISPTVYGCLNYKSPHIDDIRQTRFAYYVTSINENGSPVAIMPDKPDWLEKPILLAGPGTIVAD